MAIDIYKTRTMLEVLRQMLPAHSFLRDMFFKGEKTFDTESVDIDIVKGTRKIAAYVNPLAEGKVVDGEGYETKTFKPPYLKEKMPIKPQDLFTRAPGSTIYAPGDGPGVKAQRELGEKLAMLRNRFSRREEVQAAQAMNEGKVTVVGEGVNAIVDFGMPTANKITLAGTDLWTDAASDPIENMIEWSELAAKASGLVPNTLILGIDAYKTLRKNEKFRGTLDNRRIKNGEIDPRLLPNGVSYIGSINEAGVDLDLYTYAEWYVDPTDGLTKPMVPADKVWMGSTSARNRKLYGAIQDMDAGGLAAVKEFPKTWVEKDPSVMFLMLQSAPLMAMEQPDAFISATVI